MSPVAISQAPRWTEAVRHVAALEYALIDACHGATQGPWEEERARLAVRAGAAQVHLFDLGSALRELGDESLSYSRCVRLAMLQSGRPEEILHRLERAYEKLVSVRELPVGLRRLLGANLAEHMGLDHVQEFQSQMAC